MHCIDIVPSTCYFLCPETGIVCCYAVVCACYLMHGREECLSALASELAGSTLFGCFNAILSLYLHIMSPPFAFFPRKVAGVRYQQIVSE